MSDNKSIQDYLKEYQEDTYSPSPLDNSFLKELHSFSYKGRDTLKWVNTIGCFHCLSVKRVEDINEWTDDDETAVCTCGIDSVLPLSTLVSNEENARRLMCMNEKYFTIPLNDGKVMKV